jgi:hypothetical protein
MKRTGEGRVEDASRGGDGGMNRALNAENAGEDHHEEYKNLWQGYIIKATNLYLNDHSTAFLHNYSD